MKINVHFRNGSQYWQDLVLLNARKAAETLSDPRFIEKVRAWPKFDFTKDSPDEVASRLANLGAITINVGFYSKWLTRAIAYEDSNGVYFNTRKEASGAGGKGNIAHELMHQLGFVHNGNSPAGNENSVPWRIGKWVEEWNPLQAPTCKVDGVPIEAL